MTGPLLIIIAACFWGSMGILFQPHPNHSNSNHVGGTDVLRTFTREGPQWFQDSPA